MDKIKALGWKRFRQIGGMHQDFNQNATGTPHEDMGKGTPIGARFPKFTCVVHRCNYVPLEYRFWKLGA